MRSLVLACALSLYVALNVAALAPHLVSYQGRLTDSGGSPVADAVYSVTFKIYDDPVGGIVLWGETQNVTTSNGLFSVQLGTVTPIDPSAVFGDSTTYLAIQVGADPELTPRTRLTSTPYALTAANAAGWNTTDSVISSEPGKRVGIGTTIPSARLHVFADSSDQYAAEFHGPKKGIESSVVGFEYGGYTVGIHGASTNMGNYGFSYGVWGEAMGTQQNFGIAGSSDGGTTNVGVDGSAQDNNAAVNYAFTGRASGGDKAYGISVTVSNATSDNRGGVFTTDAGQVSIALDAQATNGSFSTIGLNADATSDGFTSYGVIANAHGGGKNLGVYGSAYGGTTNFAGYFSKGYPSVQPAANSIAVFENDTHGYLSILGPDAAERGILFGQPANEAAGGIIYNAGSAPDGLSFRTVSNSTKMVITGGGLVGINTTAPSQRLSVNGNICYTGSIGACSDARFKTNVCDLRNGLQKVINLRAVTYKWKKDDYPDREFDNLPHLGFIAQEVEKLVPEVVTTDADGYESVDYGRLTPVLVEAIQEQQKAIEQQKAEIAELKSLVHSLVQHSSERSTATYGQK